MKYYLFKVSNSLSRPILRPAQIMNFGIKGKLGPGQCIFKFFFFLVNFAFQWLGWFCLFNGVKTIKFGYSLARLDSIIDKQILLFYGFATTSDH